MPRTAIYARSSPDCSLSADQQIDELKRIAIERGWTVTHVFTDRPTSVKKGQDRRPGELALVQAIQSGAIEKVLMWSLCQIGKSLTESVAFLETCQSAGVAVSLYLSGKATGTEILRGQAAARALSIRLGRPPLGKSKVEKAKLELTAGKGVRQVARLAGISPASVSRILTSINLEASAASPRHTATLARSYPAETASPLRS